MASQYHIWLPRTSPVLVRCRALTLLTFLCLGTAATAFASRPASNLAAGKAAYGQYCARCHGDAGKGDGVDAKRFYPRPRDLTAGKFKFRTTATGTPPSDDDLFHSITDGLPGSNMPDWQHLSEETRWQLVEYLKSLSPVFQNAKPEPAQLGTDPGPEHADLRKGRQVFEKLGCAACHGANGRANGTSAAGLVDEWGMPIRPADLTQGWAYRGGSDPKAIVTRVLAGIDGSGMPSYAGAVEPVDVWQMAYYVASLQEPPRWNMIVHAAPIAGELPSTVDDSRWAGVERTDVRLRNTVEPAGEWAAPPTVQSLSFQVVANAEAAAFRFSWDDPTEDGQAPHDGLALLFKPSGSQGDVVTLQAWPYAGAPQLDLCYWSAASKQTGEALATEYEGVISQPHPAVVLTSAARYDGGRWTLMVQRPLHPSKPAGATVIAPGELTSVAFAVWDGGNPTARAVSAWLDVIVGASPKTAAAHHR